MLFLVKATSYLFNNVHRLLIKPIYVKQELGKMFKTRLGLAALGFSAVSFLFIFLAFGSSSWLVTDGQIEPSKTKFENLGKIMFIIPFILVWMIHDRISILSGLWFICFKNFEDPRHLYDTKFKECWWFYEEEYYIIHEFLLPGKSWSLFIIPTVKSV